MAMMRSQEATLLLLLLVSFFSVSVTLGYEGEGGGDEGREGRGGGGGDKDRGMFLLQHSKQVVRTDGGEMRVVRSFRGRGVENPLHIGFLTMEPSTLFIPQYIDSNLILFIRRGEMKIGWIYNDKLVEKQLKTGDIYRIPAGSTFYMVNTGKGQKLQIICSIDPSESLRLGVFQSFFIGGGVYPQSVLAGFDRKTLTTAFNISSSELEQLLTRQIQGPIMYITNPDQPSKWASFMQLKHQQMGKEQGDEIDQEEEQSSSWSWRKLLISILDLGNEEEKNGKNKKTVHAPDSYNLYEKDPDFKNNYGWSLALDETDYSPLQSSGVGVYLVNLTAGSMMAPHVNPTATEYGIVLSGSGNIQVVFPNGSSAMNTEVKEGDVFWIPRYFPFCQIASRWGPMEFFGFTTSARKNRPQFLVGANSVLKSMSDAELATAFGVSQEEFRKIRDSQHESVILRSPQVAPLKKEEEKKKEEGVLYMHPMMRSVGSEMIMGFD